MSQGANPVIQKRRLRSELRQIREDAGMFQKDVADALEWSVSKLIRIETGAVGISKTDLIALLQHYGVTDRKRVDELIEVSRSSRQNAWWDKYREHHPPQFLTFLGFEASAKVLRQFQVLTLPGLLQTREYARAMIEISPTTPEQTSMGVDLRLERQRLLQVTDDPPKLFFIVDEAVLRRQVGGPEVMRAQLERLKELNHRPNISIQVARFGIGAYIGMRGAFTVFEFPYEDEDYAVLLEYSHRDELVPNDPEQAAEFVEIFYELESVSSPKSDTDRIIDDVLATFPSDEPAPAHM
ncbi:helix-turn-helix domain-containing protein [Actinocrispum wychmicini]|uniref:Helix-turn-helix protein n=1 Tax=Actinocrispum wychmicini TaxID=1213861 RepID=A0A4R2JTX8_9PSEU|nr:helix-turn-helix transcriptional regulator [Actinocrispum wychmicini]TCO62472.1 helix-turn-helix protein [Actinocrispum wychmicini]